MIEGKRSERVGFFGVGCWKDLRFSWKECERSGIELKDIIFYTSNCYSWKIEMEWRSVGLSRKQ